MNFENRTLFIHDNLPVLRGMDTDSVDLVYLDPPFGNGIDWGMWDDRWAAAEIGSPSVT